MKQQLGLLTAVILALLLCMTVGCSRDEQKQQQPQAQASKKRVVIPDEVAGQWKAVRINVFDKTTNSEETYTVDIGYEFSLSDPKVRLKVNTFLPAFVMEGTMMTSDSNDPKNPAVQITITEDGTQIFKGWLFSRFPGTHAFQHPRYSFTLVDYIPSEAKKG